MTHESGPLSTDDMNFSITFKLYNLSRFWLTEEETLYHFPIISLQYVKMQCQTHFLLGCNKNSYPVFTTWKKRNLNLLSLLFVFESPVIEMTLV